MFEALDACRCPGPSVHSQHAECQGRYARQSESYTPALARKVHAAFLKDIQASDGYVSRCAAAVTTDPGESSGFGLSLGPCPDDIEPCGILPRCVHPPLDAVPYAAAPKSASPAA